MTDRVLAFPQLSSDVTKFCKDSNDAFVQAAPQGIQAFLQLGERLPVEYRWRYSDEDSIKVQANAANSPGEVNRIFWTDQARNVESYLITTMWRGAELLTPAVRSLNLGELLTPAVLSRSLLELSASFLFNANQIHSTLSSLNFPLNTVVLSRDFEEKVVRMIWATRLGEPEEHLKQTNILTVLKKLSKNSDGAGLLPHYEYLCELAHPNVIGNSRFWSHVETVHVDGSQTRVLERLASGDSAIMTRASVLWALGWSSAAMSNAFALVHDSLRSLLAKI